MSHSLDAFALYSLYRLVLVIVVNLASVYAYSSTMHVLNLAMCVVCCRLVYAPLKPVLCVMLCNSALHSSCVVQSYCSAGRSIAALVNVTMNALLVRLHSRLRRTVITKDAAFFISFFFAINSKL